MARRLVTVRRVGLWCTHGGTRTRESQGGFQIMRALAALNKKEGLQRLSDTVDSCNGTTGLARNLGRWSMVISFVPNLLFECCSRGRLRLTRQIGVAHGPDTLWRRMHEWATSSEGKIAVRRCRLRVESYRIPHDPSPHRETIRAERKEAISRIIGHQKRGFAGDWATVSN